jgi:hypothetical protein
MTRPSATDVLRQEIARRREEIAVLEKALGVLEADSSPLQLPAPSREPGSSGAAYEAGGTGIFSVNGHDLRLGAKMFAVLEAINEAEDCCPLETLLPLAGGNKVYLHQYTSALNKKLRPAGAEIVFFKGEGWRLQNIEGEEGR